MKAAYFERYGKPKVLEVREVSRPEPGPNEILVEVHATTVNRTDGANLMAKPWIMRLMQGLIRPKRKIPGTDFAGVVSRAGEEVTRFQAGDRVFGFKDGGLSTQAEYLVVSQDDPVDTIPAGIDFVTAAASLEGAHYAHNFETKVEIRPDHRVMLNGATGAIGSALLQFVKNRGAYVTATGDGPNLEKLKALGADQVIDFQKDDFTKQNETYDFVFDAVGKSTFGKCRRLLKKPGRYISSELGPGGQNIFLSLAAPLTGAKKVLFPLPLDIPASIRHVKGLLQTGKFQPLIDRTYPLKEVAAAYEYVISGKKTGNVILKIR